MQENAFQNPYGKFLHSVEKPARYIGEEHNLVRKDWDDALATVALCFPDTYEIGMSHLGFKILYEEINKQPNLLAERCFTPWIDMEKELRKRELPLVSLESFKPLNQFDIVGFSLQYEMSYSNILTMLDLGQIPLWAKDRSNEDPFVISGGPCATHPEPIAPFMDFIVIGDGEILFAKVSEFIGEARENKMNREDILLELANWNGIYVPKFYQTELDDISQLEYVSGAKQEYKGRVPDRIQRYIIESLKDYPFPTKSPIPHMTAIFDRFSVELARGCTEGCRFCQAGMIYRPVRERSPRQVVDMVMDGIKEGGFDEASLTCLSTADYSAVTPLVVELLDKLAADKSTLGISSLRAYGLDNRILDKLAEVKNSSLTFAPEAGTQRMRKVINKNISEEDMMQTARDVFGRGWKKMKLYFMIGLPTETDDDVHGIMDTGRKAREIGRNECGVHNPDITVSVSTFVPKPHTPFQWAAMLELDEIMRKQNMLKDYSKQYRLSFRKHFSKISILEGIITRGDRRLASLIHLAWEKGARFDGWDETFDYNLWVDCIEELGIEPKYMLGTIPLTAKLPWDHIDVGLKDKFLVREWMKATKDRLSPPCGKVAGDIVHDSNLETLEKKFDIDKKRLVCYHCGIECDLTGMVEERRDYLGEMGAFKDEEYVAPVVLKKDIAALRDKRGQFLGIKYRVKFSKLGPIAFIGHLDLQKIMARIFKRAQVDLLHSEGYKLRPLISFGPALSLGVHSLEEFFDVRVPVEWDNIESIIAALNEHSEKGIIFQSAQEIQKKTTSIQASVKETMFFAPAEHKSFELKSFLDADQIEVESFQKKTRKVRTKNIKDFVSFIEKDAVTFPEGVGELISQVQDLNENNGLIIKLKTIDGRTLKPLELQEGLAKVGIDIGIPIKLQTFSEA